MTWSAYGSFLALAIVLVLVPGQDFAVVTKNALASGRRRGWWSAAGVACSNSVQGAVAAAGLGAVIVRVEPLFEAVKWAGVVYLFYLALQAARSAVRGTYPPPDALLEGDGGRPGRGVALTGWRQGFLSNITNPKVLVFYLAVLPQFLTQGVGVGVLMSFALSHAALSLLYLSILVTVLHWARRWLVRRTVRRVLDGATATVLTGFGIRLASEQA